MVETNSRKFTLSQTKDAAAVRDFLRLVSSFFREQQVDLIAIKQRATKGGYAGGATTFKMEGLIQVATEASVIFISPQLISRRVAGVALPAGLNKYQDAAFRTALVALDQNG